jgi:regulator of protease activity HflC (stomatin/prohibitin superfamily)
MTLSACEQSYKYNEKEVDIEGVKMEAYDVKSQKGTNNANSIMAAVIGIVLSIIIAYFVSLGSATSFVVAFIVVMLIYLAMSVKILAEWRRAPILSLGRYRGIYGPGVFMIIPLIQSMPYNYDLRTFSTTFSAERTLTSDNVGVDVDAIMFSKVEDPEKTVLQVSNMADSVTLAAQTALRDVIGKVELSKMIQGRSEIADEVKALIDERVLPWGVNVISVELRDVRIPAELQDAMAKVAIASRERDARVVLAESEKLAAQKMIDAANLYKGNHYAMQLRALNMLYEIGISGKNSLVFIPTESRGLGMPTPIGVFSLDDIKSGKVNVNDLNMGGSPPQAQSVKGKKGKPQQKDDDEEEGL